MTSPDEPAWRAYVVQHHTGFGPDHFDLMLQHGEALWTWQLDRPPADAGSGPIAARRIADHRTAYLTCEGPVSRGRGRVRIVDRGRYRLLSQGDGEWALELADGAAAGVFVLRRTGDEWTLSRRTV